MATEAIEQWQQLQLRAFTVILVCIKRSVYLLLTMITEQPLSSFIIIIIIIQLSTV